MALLLLLSASAVSAQGPEPVVPCVCVYQQYLVETLMYLTGARPAGEPAIDDDSLCAEAQRAAHEAAMDAFDRLQEQTVQSSRPPLVLLAPFSGTADEEAAELVDCPPLELHRWRLAPSLAVERTNQFSRGLVHPPERAAM